MSNLFSFSEADCATAKALAERDSKPSSATVNLWWQKELAKDAEDAKTIEVIELGELFSFFQHPQRYFLRRQMDLRFSGIAADIEEREPFSVAMLDGYAIYHEWIHEALNGKPVSVKKLQAQGRWLAGVPGELEFERQQKTINQFVELIKTKNLGALLDDLPIDITLDSCRLVGKLSNLYRNGSLLYRYANLKGKDFICALLHHAVINQVQKQGALGTSGNYPPVGVMPLASDTTPKTAIASLQPTFLLSADEDLSLLPEHYQPDHLTSLIDIYRLGREQPDAFFVEPAFAYIKQAHKLAASSRASKSALDAAIEQLTKAIEQPYEPELRRLYGNVANLGVVLGDSFEQQCQTLLQPVWNATH